MPFIVPTPFTRNILLVFTSVILLLTACDGGSDPDECSGLSPTYTADFKPILDSSCAKSGGHDAFTAQNGVNLSNYTTASAIGQQEDFWELLNTRQVFHKCLLMD